MERTDAKGFVTDFNRTYKKKTELRRICGHRFYGDKDGNAESTGNSEDNDSGDDNDSDNDGRADTDAGGTGANGTEGPERLDYEQDSLRYFQVGRHTTVPVSLIEERRYSYVSDAVVGV